MARRGESRSQPAFAGGAADKAASSGEQSEQRFVARERVFVVALAGLDYALDPLRRSGQYALDFVGLGGRSPSLSSRRKSS